jgi:hypothetical protein
MVMSTRCLKCGKRLVPFHALSGRTEFQCIWCTDLVKGVGAKWADSPPADAGVDEFLAAAPPASVPYLGS